MIAETLSLPSWTWLLASIPVNESSFNVATFVVKSLWTRPNSVLPFKKIAVIRYVFWPKEPSIKSNFKSASAVYPDSTEPKLWTLRSSLVLPFRLLLLTEALSLLPWKEPVVKFSIRYLILKSFAGSLTVKCKLALFEPPIPTFVFWISKSPATLSLSKDSVVCKRYLYSTNKPSFVTTFSTKSYPGLSNIPASCLLITGTLISELSDVNLVVTNLLIP